MNKVTIISSLYKAEKYLSNFLNNIVAQSIFDQCEVYLVDGNSPEKEHEIVKPYLDKYKNIRYEKLDQDPGIYSCWNLAIEKTNSEYITNANVDDRLFPLSIEKHVRLLDSQSDIDVAYCYNVKSTTPNMHPSMLRGNEPIFTTGEFSIENMLKANLPHNHPVWRRSLHNKFGYFNTEDYVSGSDWEFVLRCAVGGVKMKLIPQVLGMYYDNPEGMSTKPENMERNLKEVDDIRNKYTSMLELIQNEA